MQSTPNYLWSTEDLLGQGATAYVYKARNKVSGGNWGGRNPKTTEPRCPSSLPPHGMPELRSTRPPGRSLAGEQLRGSFGFYFHFPWAPSLGRGRLLGCSQPGPARRLPEQRRGKELFSGECPEVLKTPSLAICIVHANTCQPWSGLSSSPAFEVY